MRCLVMISALLLLVPSAAQAAWYEASSEHFVVYADDSESDIREFSEQLEHFHQAMSLVTGMQTETPSPSNRVTVFVVSSDRQVRRLLGDGSRNAAGFYIPRAGSSVAYTARIRTGTGEPDFSMVVLLHEYAHHFLFSASSFPMPLWWTEGAAEFFASAEFERDGSLNVGMPATHRAAELVNAPDVNADELLDPELYQFDRRGRYDAFYGKSWLLYHYLTFEPERAGQMARYLTGMIRGKSSREAAEEAFGDLRSLEMELQRYMRQPKMLSFVLAPEQLRRPEIAIRRLTAGEEAMMPVQMRSRRGVTREQALELLDEAREISAEYPQDPAVLASLAEAEFDAGNDTEAIAAADAALALDPERVDAYVQKGFALFRRAGEAQADQKEAAYERALEPFLAVNRLENDHPLPLIYYYRSFVERGVGPDETAIHGLERAAELAPFDLGLRITLARQHAMDGRLPDALYHLLPVAHHPHGGGLAEHARTVKERLEEGPIEREEVVELFAPRSSSEGDGEG